ncbi:HNH endonuclease [Trebonia kvetii]|uniref:HNH endonuclease n=1 Tax=Trebonia kvetii TaxID=2480626 RepID=A0A6P2BUU7_9ACTN|nr:HNH endonuclease signature motif containing protein [Trebonia kvetii]TVZ02670.1 HNH endonuclease [Trebonia kvetii]
MGDPDSHGPVRPGPPPNAVDDGDVEWAEYVAWLEREAAAGRDPASEASARCAAEPWDAEPEERDLCGPLFAEDGAADALPPGPLLAALTEQAVADVTSLSDNELVGVLRATQRQLAREQYKQVLAAAEFGRRRQAEFDDALRRGVPAGCAPGGFPGEELSVELTVSRAEAAHLIDDAIDLISRLPRTLTGMAAGLVDAARAGWIAMYTRSLDPADTARADEILAEAAPELRAEQLARKAAALEMKLNPAAVKARREQARRDNQRVDVRREASGNASLAGRELDVADVLASKAYLDAVASRLRASGLDGSLDQLRALALTDLTQGRDPLNRIQPAADQSAPADPPPVPALINLLVPAGTLLGLSTAPAQAGSWGLLDVEDARAVAAAAAMHPQTRWCVTLTGPDGTALAHGCARGPRPRLLDNLQTRPPPAQLAELLGRLNLTLIPVTRGNCDHAAAEDHYSPSRALRHLVRARSATCDAPGCQNPAASTDLDHTVPWPGGPTDQCNLAPRCRTHHRAKQAPDWTARQSAPGVTRWTLPSGRTHVTTPTKYET